MIKDLVPLHLEFGLYNGFPIKQGTWVPKIVNMLSKDTETKYLADFHLDYLNLYRTQLAHVNHNPTLNSSVTGVSRAVDLPYIGSEAIKIGNARYFLVFEGSLGNPYEPSITVLSCLWSTNCTKAKENILSEFWHGKGKRSFEFIVKCLGMNKSIAKECFVTDAVRIANENEKPYLKKNRELLHREIEIMNPEYVILLGSKAKQTYGRNPNNTSRKVVYLPFPTKNYKSKQDIEILESKFQYLKDEVWGA